MFGGFLFYTAIQKIWKISVRRWANQYWAGIISSRYSINIQYFNIVNLVVNALTALSLQDDAENETDDIKSKEEVMIDHFKKMVALYTECKASERGESNTQGN